MNILEATQSFFTNNKKPDQKALDADNPTALSFADPDTSNGAHVVEGGRFNHYIDFNFDNINESELISRYRTISRIPDVSRAIDEVVNEIITENDQGDVIELDLDDVDVSDAVKKTYHSEFKRIIKKFDLLGEGYNHIRRWYVDGKIYFHPVIDQDNTKDGIIEFRYIPPTSLKFIKEIERVRSGEIALTKVTKEYYVFDPTRKLVGTSIVDKAKQYLGGTAAYGQSQSRIVIEKDSIVTSNSGIYDDDFGSLISHLHPALKVANQLSTMVDSLVIYRIARAPERRIFYVDVGNLQQQKADQYMKDMMAKFKNQVTYDAVTGEIKDARRNMNMLEDFWIPRRQKGNATEITTLPGGQTLGQIDDINYFKEELWRSLKIPKARFNPDQSPGMVGIGRSSEITRDEIRFQKFIDRLRSRLSAMFIDALGIQLITKKIVTKDEWVEIKELISTRWSQDSFFVEMKESEILRERNTARQMVDPFEGKWFDDDFIFQRVLRMTKEEEALARKAKEKFDKTASLGGEQ